MSDEPTHEKINYDLGSLEAGPGPFVFTTKDGAKFTTRNPREMDWQDLAQVDTANPFEMVETFFDPDERKRFLGTKVSGLEIDALVDKLVKHYELDQRVVGGRGNRPGSRS